MRHLRGTPEWFGGPSEVVVQLVALAWEAPVLSGASGKVSYRICSGVLIEQPRCESGGAHDGSSSRNNAPL
jgi:hypothetical protein